MASSDASDLTADVLTYGYRWTQAEDKMINLSYADELRDRAQIAFVERAARQRKRVASSSFERLPFETLQMVFWGLSPGALQNLGATNFNFAQQVHAFQPYQELVQHAPRAMAALAQTGLIGQFSITQLHIVLHTDRCERCEHYAPYLYLLRCARLCYSCHCINPRSCSTLRNTAMRSQGLFEAEMRLLPTLQVIPGIYASSVGDAMPRKRRLHLVNLESAYELSHYPTQDFYTFFRGAIIETDFKDQLQEDRDRYAFIASVAFPYIDRSAHDSSIQHGLWCRGCQYSPGCWRDDEPSQDISYSRGDFEKHLETCKGLGRLRRCEAEEKQDDELRNLRRAETQQGRFSARLAACQERRDIVRRDDSAVLHRLALGRQ